MPNIVYIESFDPILPIFYARNEYLVVSASITSKLDDQSIQGLISVCIELLLLLDLTKFLIHGINLFSRTFLDMNHRHQNIKSLFHLHAGLKIKQKRKKLYASIEEGSLLSYTFYKFLKKSFSLEKE